MLSRFLVTELFAFLLIFCRTGSAIMLLPGFGEAYVTPRVRLMLALMFSLILVPIIKNLPGIPDTTVGLVGVMGSEIMIGLFMGSIGRMLISAIHTAGTVIAYQSSMSSALTNDIAQFQGQDTSIGNLMSFTVVVLIFVTDLHHLMLRSLVDSYNMFTPGVFPSPGDMAQQMIHTAGACVRMAAQLAAPHIVVGVIVYLSAGILSRLMPNIQIFFIMTAPLLLLSFFILMIVFSGLMMWYLDFFRLSIATFGAP